MYILLAGLSHKTAPVELRERIALSGKALERFYQDIKEEPALEGTVVLSTCNRVEVYSTTRDLEAGKKALRELVARRLEVDDKYLDRVLYMPNCYQAIEHLFRVASGLESMVLGETEILGQVRGAYDQARERGVSSGVLNTLFQKAISVGKRVRTETGLDRNAVSISYAAVEKAKQVLAVLRTHGLVVGAGKMSGLALGYLMDNGVTTVVVSNRSYDRALELAQKVGGEAVRLNRLYEELKTADIVISCTAASHYVIRREDLEPCLEKRSTELLLIDIAVPRYRPRHKRDTGSSSL